MNRNHLLFGVGLEIGFELLKEGINHFVPAVENGVAHGGHRLAHHSHVFLIHHELLG